MAEVPSSEGLLIHLEASLLYRLDPQRATDVYQKIGPDYLNVARRPQLAVGDARDDRRAHGQRALQRRAGLGRAADAGGDAEVGRSRAAS